MIARVSGTLLSSDLDRVEVMTAGGVAYLVHIPLSVAESLPRPGGTIELHTALVVRDDGWTLYGFAAAGDRALFQRLLGTTGVGPSLAMNLMSALGGDRLVRAIQEKDLAVLTRVPRVGKKLAERLVLELQDKLVARGARRPVRRTNRRPVGRAPMRCARWWRSATRPRMRRRRCSGCWRTKGPADTAQLIRKALSRASRSVASGVDSGMSRAEITTPEVLADESVVELSLRPQRLAEFIGQGQGEGRAAHLHRRGACAQEPLDHALFFGPPGLGKTTLAELVAANSA